MEIACGGGVGRTGTAMALLAVMSGVAPDKAVAWVRENYHGAQSKPDGSGSGSERLRSASVRERWGCARPELGTGLQPPAIVLRGARGALAIIGL